MLRMILKKKEAKKRLIQKRKNSDLITPKILKVTKDLSAPMPIDDEKYVAIIKRNNAALILL